MFGYMLTNRIIKYTCVLITLPLWNIAHTQDLEELPDSLYFKANGGINLGLSAYAANGMNARRDPFSYVLNANLVINISDAISMPFSATLSSGSKTFSQPRYNIVGISPKYKAVTVHAGYRNMQFSSYTLNGISFFGLGVEVAPEESFWKFKALGGRFAKGIPFNDEITGKIELPSYQRMGWGSMLTLGNKDYSADLIVFKATDNHHSISIPDSLQINPKENLTFGFNTRLKLAEKLFLTTEYAGSAFTEDTRMDELFFDRYTYLNNLGKLYTPRESSSFHKALGATLTYSNDKNSFGATFQRVDPDYKTLGSTYMNNDYRNITFNLSRAFLDNRITFSGNYGVQKNNLENDREVAESRIIGAAQIACNMTDKLNLMGNYSNYTTSSNPTYLNLIDSLRYMQVAGNYGVIVAYSTGSEVASHNLNLNLTMQTSDMLNNTATEVTESKTRTKNAVFSYTLSYLPLQVNINSSLNFTLFESENVNSTTIGPVFSIQRPLLNKKINSSLSFSYMNSVTDGNNNTTSVIRLNAAYKVRPKHTIKLSVSGTGMKRMVPEENSEELVKQNSNELRCTLNYAWNF
jgi:hypothetical protein